jgi:hypothetical protein
MGLVARYVVQRKAEWGGVERRFNQTLGKMHAAVRAFDRTVLREQGLRLVIDHIHPDLGQHDFCLGDDSIRQIVVE